MVDVTFKHKKDGNYYFVYAEELSDAWHGLIVTVGKEYAVDCDLISIVEVNKND